MPSITSASTTIFSPESSVISVQPPMVEMPSASTIAAVFTSRAYSVLPARTTQAALKKPPLPCCNVMQENESSGPTVPAIQRLFKIAW